MFAEYGSMCSLVEATLPDRVAGEQVKGALKDYVKNEGRNHTKDLKNKMLQIKRPNGEQHFAAFGWVLTCPKPFIKATRNRLWGCSEPSQPTQLNHGNCKS